MPSGVGFSLRRKNMAMLQISKNDFLHSFPFFRECPETLVKDILSSARPHTIPEDQFVFREGDSCSVIAFLFSGEIRVYKIGDTGREITLYDVNEGEICLLNAACILSNQSYPAHALATLGGHALVLTAGEFLRLMNQYDDMRHFVFSGLSGRLISMMNLVEAVAFQRVDKRLRDYILEQAGDGVLRMTHQKIANELGTSREVISRLLEDFEKKGQIRLSRNRIDIVRL